MGMFRPRVYSSYIQIALQTLSSAIGSSAPIAQRFASRQQSSLRSFRTLPQSSSPPTPPRLGATRYRSSVSLTSLIFAGVLAAGVTYAAIGVTSVNQKEIVKLSVKETPLEIMATTQQLPPGRPGNLTAEQEAKLKEMWSVLFDLVGVTKKAPVDTENPIPNAAETDKAPKKKRNRLSIFSRNKDKNDTDADSNEINEKHNQSKEFANALSVHTPEELNAACWRMTKFDHPDALLLRFLRARKWDVHAALVMLIATLHWRMDDMHVDEDILGPGEEHALKQAIVGASPELKKDGEDFMVQLRTGKSYLHGTDAEGRPCCYVRARLHKQGEQSEKSLERFTVYTIETARMMLRAPVDTATIVFDMTDFTLANMDYTPVKFMIKCFEANYPESLGSVLVYKAPWVFSSIWKIVRGWLDPVVAGKVHFASNIDELSQHIPRAQIPRELGGDEAWDYAYVEPADGENERLVDGTRFGVEKGKLEEERAGIVKEFTVATEKWIAGETKGRAEGRDEVAERLKRNYWALDPFVRARSLYDRTGVIREGGEVVFYPEKKESV